MHQDLANDAVSNNKYISWQSTKQFHMISHNEKTCNKQRIKIHLPMLYQPAKIPDE